MAKIMSLFFLTVLATGSLAHADCLAPWGRMIAEGQSVTAYYEAKATGGSRCQMEIRYCRNSILSGFYRFDSCTEDFGCQDFTFGYVPHGMHVIAYRNAFETGGRQCEQEFRICSFGRLSGTFTNRMCTSLR